jgi:hypothetical protein
MNDPGNSTIIAGPPERFARVWWAHLAAFLLILVELCWVVPWYRTVIQISYVATPLRATMILGTIMLCGYLLSILLEYLNFIPVLHHGLLILGFFLALVSGARGLLNSDVITIVSGMVKLDPGAVLVLFFVLWIWWRGVFLGIEAVRPKTAWRRFVLGMWLLMAHVYLISRMGDVTPGILLMGFFLLVGLLSLAVARISYVSVSHQARRNPFDRRWFASIFSFTALAVGMAVFLGSVLVGEYRTLLDQAARILHLIFMGVVFIISLPFVLLAYLFSPLVAFFSRYLPVQTPRPLQTVEPYPAIPDLSQISGREPLVLSQQVQVAIFWFLIILLILVILVVRRRVSGWVGAGYDDSESLLEKGQAADLMRKAVLHQVDEAGRRLSQLLAAKQKVLNEFRIRQIYSDLLDLCAQLHAPRPVSMTPFEFIPVLGELFPQNIQDAVIITQAYVRIRYGETPELLEDMQGIEAAWASIQVAGRLAQKRQNKELVRAETTEVQRPGL